MKENLKYFWKINLAVIFGAAIAAAVLTGALLVGDSVRGSLRDITLQRLGDIDYVMPANRFFREALARDLATAAGFDAQFDAASAGVIITGSAVHPRSKARASRVDILGIDISFLEFYEKDPALLETLTGYFKKPQGKPFNAIVINEALQKELNVDVGEAVLLYLERKSDIHRESLFGRKETDDVVRTLRLTVTAVIPDNGMGRFSLRPNQALPLNAFVSLPVLQKALEQEGRVNGLFVSQNDDVAPEIDQHDLLQSLLQKVYRLEDVGLVIKTGEGFSTLKSREFVLGDAVATPALKVLKDEGFAALPVMNYLVNKTTLNDRMMPYATIAGIDMAAAGRFGGFTRPDGTPVAALGDGEIFLNKWAADDLAAQPGDSLQLTYFQVEAADALGEENRSFLLKDIVSMGGLGADEALTPEFPGISDADNIHDWDPPFPVDLDLVRTKDELYWDDYRAAPRAFVNLATAQSLWQSRFGALTSIRFSGPETQETEARFAVALQENIQAASAGMVFQPVKAQGLKASVGATDFSGLFIGFSLFLIVSAALLVGLLFRLGVEQRVKEIGVLLAAGYTGKQVRRSFLKEGLLLAGLGCLIGLIGAVAYAGLMMAALRTLWVEATGSSYLFLHVNPGSLIGGYIGALLIVCLAIFLTLRQLKKIPAPSLLAGVTASPKSRSGKIARVIGLVSLGLALAMILYALVSGLNTSSSLFFGSGALLLIAGLTLLNAWFRQRDRQSGTLAGIWQMAAKNNARRPGRSMLCVALVACASFMIVSVGANRKDFSRIDTGLTTGVGGYTLMAESDIPLLMNPLSEAGREEFFFEDDDAPIANGATITAFRLLPGEDASCLNLYQPEKPRVLGVPAGQIERGGFTFQVLPDDADDENPWTLLNSDPGPNVIPAVADFNSAMWILHKQLGDDIVMEDDYGREIKLRLVGLLEKCVFQSELLISEENFLKHFPSRSGFSYFLIDAPTALNEVSESLESNLGDFGFDVASTTEKLAAYQAVENTYLSVFQVLGGLGLLLGTLGLGVILFRNVIERRGELATFRAFGFRKSMISQMLLRENGVLILWGVLIGSISALIAVAPHALSQPDQIPWLSLGVTLLLVFLTGLLASMVAVGNALKLPLLQSLRGE